MKDWQKVKDDNEAYIEQWEVQIQMAKWVLEGIEKDGKIGSGENQNDAIINP